MKELKLPVINTVSKLEMYHVYLKHLSPVLNITFKGNDILVLASIMDVINQIKDDFKTRQELGEYLCTKEAKDKVRINTKRIYKTDADRSKYMIAPDLFNNIITKLRNLRFFEDISMPANSPRFKKTILLCNKSIFNLAYLDDNEFSLTFSFKNNGVDMVKE